jgi:hypothetical protein
MCISVMNSFANVDTEIQTQVLPTLSAHILIHNRIARISLLYDVGRELRGTSANTTSGHDKESSLSRHE